MFHLRKKFTRAVCLYSPPHWSNLFSLPLFSHPRRYERVTDDKDRDDVAEERTESGCVAQYQSTTLRVLTHFVADNGEIRGAAEDDGMGQQNFLLGTDWQVEVTQLVKDSLRVEVPKVAQLMEGQVLIGLSAGITKIQVVWVCVSFGRLHCHFISVHFSVWHHGHVLFGWGSYFALTNQ